MYNCWTHIISKFCNGIWFFFFNFEMVCDWIYDKNKCKIVDSVHVLVFSHFYVNCLTARHVIQTYQNINDNTLPIHAKKATINNFLKTSSL